VMEAEKGSEIIAGFSKKMDRRTYTEHLEQKRLREILNREEVSAGDVFYMPAGRIHAMGPGILLAEIQQTSDTTYRIYDWDRTDDKGNPRELHTGLALDAIDFNAHDGYRTRYKSLPNLPAPLVHSPHFNTDLLAINQPIDRDHTILDSFVIQLCVEGAYRIEHENGSEAVRKGDAVFIPACSGEVRMIPEKEASFIEIYIL